MGLTTLRSTRFAEEDPIIILPKCALEQDILLENQKSNALAKITRSGKLSDHTNADEIARFDMPV